MSRWKEQSVGPEVPRISLAGTVLVAAPQWTDSVYGRSVCIVVEHSAKQAIGIVLNKRLEIDISPIWNFISDGASHEMAISTPHINFGGPQSGPIVAIHQDKMLAEGGNEFGVYLAAQADHLKQLFTASQNPFRLYIGHALWGPHELEQQIVDGAWHVLPAVPELVFDDEATMWHRAVRTIGNNVLESITGLPASRVVGLLN
jgi:putative transcriptional regulator